ncbi:hypothetical protein GPJ56_004445 [Histomonas meleagridis]|uniref:uncharacterized protein n=1 Tax=Histomonas meleagridis TaxID=135588 RepID=UPI00355A439B|nr:hypothetical protein GPJ56_004445 [Histomonas meleagridis]KAH0802027.1 hypothetical protein GO595_005108 [Histomonas meleagridis]
MNKDQVKLQAKMIELMKPLEETTSKKIKEVKVQQKEIDSKLEDLTIAFEKVLNNLPPSDLKDVIDRINSLCDRLENARSRISNISKRADTILNQLSTTTTQ